MPEIMMALGELRFSLDTAAYEQLRRTSLYRWQSQERLSERPAQQFVGIGSDTIIINGTLYPHFHGGLTQLETMRELAATGSPQLLVDGLGFVWGDFVIQSIEETQSFHLPNGIPLKQTFSLTLNHYGDIPNERR